MSLSPKLFAKRSSSPKQDGTWPPKGHDVCYSVNSGSLCIMCLCNVMLRSCNAFVMLCYVRHGILCDVVFYFV